MNVIVDTSVWSLALHRNKVVEAPETARFARAIAAGRVVLLGAVRQEVLSGIREHEPWRKLRDKLQAFPDHQLHAEDYETASLFFNTCRSQGVQGANTDFLICAVASRYDYTILTTDKDFEAFAEHVPVRLESS